MLIPVQSKPWFQQEHYLLHSEKTIIGRGSDCHVCVSHPNVSRRHIELVWNGALLVASHLSPVNPTLVNGAPLLTPRALLSGDRIEIATGIELRVELFGVNEDAPTEPLRAGERRIYSIVHADVTSYARLVENDDVGAAQQLETCTDIIRSETERQGGWIENIAGDSLLMLFSSAYSSVTASIAWQKRLRELNAPLPYARRMEFRAGVNSGDVLVTPGRKRSGRRGQHCRAHPEVLRRLAE